MNLTDHFTLEESVFSQTASRLGIHNDPTAEILANIRRTAEQMEQIRTLLGNRPILVTSWYRSQALNRAVFGAKNSAHMRGLAVDFICPQFGSPLAVCRAIAKSDLDFASLIYEYGRWTHFAIPELGHDPQRELWTIRYGGAYEEGLLAG